MLSLNYVNLRPIVVYYRSEIVTCCVVMTSVACVLICLRLPMQLLIFARGGCGVYAQRRFVAVAFEKLE